jgi:hypothetical protein
MSGEATRAMSTKRSDVASTTALSSAVRRPQSIRPVP